MKIAGYSYEKIRRVGLRKKLGIGVLLFLMTLFEVREAVAKTLIFSWNPSSESDVVGYHVAYGFAHGQYSSSHYVGGNTSFTLPNMTNGQQVFFVVQSQNSAGLRSAPSEELGVIVGSGTAPAPGNPGTPGNPGSPGGPGTRPFSRGVCADWNTTISDRRAGSTVSNIFRLQNLTRSRQQAVLGIFNAAGALLKTTSVLLRPAQRYDFGLGGKVPERQYGSVCLQQGAPIAGTMIYSFANNKRSVRRRFSFGMTAFPGLTGYQAVAFNTYQPSRNPAELGLPVANALTIRNASDRAGSGTVVMYDSGGHYLWGFQVSLAAGQRGDYSLHQVGPNLAGSAIWIPDQFDIPFVIRNTRYYYDNPLWRASFLAAAPNDAHSGSVNPGRAFLSTRGGRSSVLEISNTQGIANPISVAIYGAAGNLITTLGVTLQPSETRHVLIDGFLGPNTVGLAVVQGTNEGGAILHGMQYGYRAGKLLTASPS